MKISSAYGQNITDARGFTLIELLVVLVVMGLLLGITGPALYQANERGRLDTATAKLYDALRRARSTAVTAGAPVTFDHARIIQDASIGIEPSGPAGKIAPLIFYPDGSATAASFVLTTGNQTRRLNVDWLTGHAALVE